MEKQKYQALKNLAIIPEPVVEIGCDAGSASGEQSVVLEVPIGVIGPKVKRIHNVNRRPTKKDTHSFIEGKVVPVKPRSTNAPGRNQPCRCGSGKKFKVCCLRK